MPLGLVREPAAQGALVLVVEDDDDTRFLYMSALASMGYRTAGEYDGERGVEAVLRLQPDAVLIDVGLPVLDGIDATRLIKEDPRTSGCFVIVMTGHGKSKFEEARAAGCDAFFCKPFDPVALHEVLRTLTSPAEQSKTLQRLETVKECSCGRQFSLKQWLDLLPCGRMHLPQRGVVVELRTCTCGSSLSVEIDDLGGAVVQKAQAQVPQNQKGGVRETVLLVERDPHVRRLVQRFLGEAYVVEFIDDGYSALDRVRSSAPAAVITEILVPRLDGLALCRSLKGDTVTERVPILVISMLAAHERARLSGADAFLEKPLEKTSLVAAVRRLIDTKEGASALPPQDMSNS
ncbi:MAG: response regulator [Polyangiaceae bacterium]